MDTKIKVSIVLPTYNGSKYISRAIESVLAQTFQNWELIIVDDGSNDDTGKIVDTYVKNEKIIYLFQKNLGTAAARNKGILISRGDYVAFIDDDDEWIDKEKIGKQVEFLENNSGYVLVGTRGVTVDENNEKIMDYLVPESDMSIRESMLLKNPFIQSSVMVKKDIVVQAGLYLSKKEINAEDYNLWLRMGLLGKVFNLKGSMTKYMVRAGNTSSNHKKSILKNNIPLIKEYKNKYPNYKKALLFAHLKLFTYSNLQLVKNKKLKDMLTNLLFKKYRKL